MLYILLICRLTSISLLNVCSYPNICNLSREMRAEYDIRVINLFVISTFKFVFNRKINIEQSNKGHYV